MMFYICFNILLSFRFSWIDKQSVVFCCFFGSVVLGYVRKQTLDFETTPPCFFDFTEFYHIIIIMNMSNYDE